MCAKAWMCAAFGAMASVCSAGVVEATAFEIPGATPQVLTPTDSLGMQSISLDGLEGRDLQGSTDNMVMQMTLDANARISEISFDIWLTTAAPGLLSDAVIGIVNSEGTGIRVNIGDGIHNAGTVNVSLSDYDLESNGQAFNLLSDGVIMIELHQKFASVPGQGGSFYGEGSEIEFNVVPTPAAWALMLTCGTIAARRRRL